ncbi:hypothetical protein EEL49_02180 [Muribaculaceae bacterium Isolate-104 (HZI)]|jgi:cytochrome c biogenesis protein CcdA|nr:hypothetical protein EEL49_02180 [Muribaculaceae bacterium Isolate-104 (HZI)]
MSNDYRQTGTPQKMRNIFGIIMILVYIGVGVLFLTGFFESICGGFKWLRWVAGGILIAYGIWRGYRQFTGIDDMTR